MRLRAAFGVLMLATLARAGGDALPPPECVRVLRDARIADLAGHGAEALSLLERAARDYSEQIGPALALVRHYREHQGSPEEIVKLRALLAERLADPAGALPAGTIDFLVNNRDAGDEELRVVLAALESRLAAKPDDLALLEPVSVLQERLQLADAEHATLEKMLTLEQRPDVEWRCLALDRRAERWPEAARHLAQLLEREPNPFLRMEYIEVLGKSGDYDRIVAQLDLLEPPSGLGAEVFRGNLTGLLLQIGWDLRDLGQDDKAETLFRRILTLDPDHRDARRTILYLYSSAEERAAHEAELRRRLDEEQDPNQLLEEGAKKLASRDFAGAFDLLQRAAAALPDSEPAWFNLGLAAARVEHWDEAERALGRAIELNPQRAESYLNRGIALHFLDRCGEAIELLLQALERQGDLTASHYYLYVCYRNLGRTDEAQRHLALYEAAKGTSR